MTVFVLMISLLISFLLSTASVALAAQQAHVTWSADESATVVKSRQKPSQAVQAVQVSGMKDQDWKPYRQILNGLNAFERRHALAPDTRLRFIVRPQVISLD